MATDTTDIMVKKTAFKNNKAIMNKTTTATATIDSDLQAFEKSVENELDFMNKFMNEFAEKLQRFSRRLNKVLTRTFWVVVVLMIIRHFVPEMEESLSGVYSFLDGCILPVVNWAFDICSKVVQELLNQQWFANFLATLKGLSM